ncbi:MAG: hypothetical protein V3T44_08410 [bacterium]
MSPSSAAPESPEAGRTSTPPRFLVVPGISVLGLFLATAYPWTVEMNRRMEAREAIGRA